MKTRALAPLILLALALAPLLAHSQTSLKWNEDQLNWTAPTTCSEGSPITDCAITGYRLETASSQTSTTWTLVATTTGIGTSYKATGLAAGPHCYRVATLSGTTQSPGYSPVTSTSCATATPPAPGNPGSVTVTDVVAYEIRPDAKGAFVASRVGIVPAGSLCGHDTRVVAGVTYNRIDPKSVDLINWPTGIPPKDFFAKCGQS